jgi:flagellar assembly protein FliH
LSEVVHIRRIPRARVKLIRVHAAQPSEAEHIVPTETMDGVPVHAHVPRVIHPEGVCTEDLPDPAEALAGAYARGEAEGRRIAEGEFKEVLTDMRRQEGERIGAIFASISSQMREVQKNLETDAYRFALAVAERIIKREVTLSDDIVLAQIREAVQRIVGVESIRLRVHPADEDVVKAHRNAFLGSLGGVREMTIETDEGMERGGCIIDSASGNIDARISTQLKQIEAALFGASANRGESLP